VVSDITTGFSNAGKPQNVSQEARQCAGLAISAIDPLTLDGTFLGSYRGFSTMVAEKCLAGDKRSIHEEKPISRRTVGSS
jgi:hypothetical protein